MMTTDPLNFRFPGILDQVGDPPGKTVPELFAQQVEKNPDRVALIGLDQAEQEHHLTYRELNRKANRLAGLLKHRRVTRHTIVAIMVKSTLEMIIGMMGVLKAGGAFVYIPPGYPQDRILWILDQCGADILLTGSRILGDKSFTRLQGLEPGVLKPYLTPSRPQVMDFGSIPIPDRSLVDYEKYNKYIGMALVKNTISIQGTRGCPYGCAYCHKIWPRTHVVRPAEHIFEEVELFYQVGVRRFTFIDDIFNLDIKNSRRFFQLIIKNNLALQLFFPNGMRGDILTKEYIDLMVEAGTVNLALALETASPRLQKLIRKNLSIPKLQENIEYICQIYPHVILDLFTIHGFPSETVEEAMMTLDFIKCIKWLHFPFVFLLKIYPHTEMEKLALEAGISREAVLKSENLFFHQLSHALQFEKSFTLKYQADFLNNYFLLKERLLHVLPYQMKILSEDEILQKYNSYLPGKIDSFAALLEFIGIKEEELPADLLSNNQCSSVPHLKQKIKTLFPSSPPKSGAIRILLLDLTLFFSQSNYQYHELVEPPLGLMYLLAYLQKELGGLVKGKIIKSGIDFDSYSQLKREIETFKPDLIGIRTLSSYRDFLHQTAALIRQWGIDVPIISGGPYATSSYETILQDPAVDLVVLGEGEVSFTELVEKFIANHKKLPGEDTLKKIKGLAFVLQEEKKKNNYAREILMLDHIHESQPGEIRETTGSFEYTGHAADPARIIFTFDKTGKAWAKTVDHTTLISYMKKGYLWDAEDDSPGSPEWWRMGKTREEINRQESYWTQEFSSGIPRLNLPTDFKPPGPSNFQVYRMGQWDFQIGVELTGKIKEAAKKQGASLHSLLLAAYCVLIYKLSRQEDIVVGVSLETRGHLALSRIPGPLINKNAIRYFPTPGKRFFKFLKEIREKMLQARQNQDYPIETMMDKKVFNVVFAFLPSKPHFSYPLRPQEIRSPYELVLIAAEEGSQLSFTLLYSSQLFKEATIARYSQYLRDILGFVTPGENDGIQLKNIKISSDLLDREIEIPRVDFGF